MKKKGVSATGGVGEGSVTVNTGGGSLQEG